MLNWSYGPIGPIVFCLYIHIAFFLDKNRGGGFMKNEGDYAT